MKKKIAVLCCLVLLLSSCAKSKNDLDKDETAKPIGSSSQGKLKQATKCNYVANGSPSKPVDPPDLEGATNLSSKAATLVINNKDVEISLTPDKAPCAVYSFLSLAKQGYFDNTKCHRLTDSGIFILQCGDPTATGTGGPGYRFDDELSGNEKYVAGTVAMANSGPNTNGSQFFMVYKDSTQLPANYTVFGHLNTAGIEFVNDIASQGVSATDGMSPIAEAKIQSVTLG